MRAEESVLQSPPEAQPRGVLPRIDSRRPCGGRLKTDGIVFDAEVIFLTRRLDYDYAIVRVVPRVHLCTFVNVGVVLHARTARFLDARFALDRDLLAHVCPSVDFDLVERYLGAFERVCHGAQDAGPIALLPPSERFHWLTTPRSAVLQPSEVHAGRTRDPQVTLEQLFTMHVKGA